MADRTAVTDVVDGAAYKQFLVREDAPAFVFLAAHLALLAATGVLVYLSLGTWWLLPAWFAHGTVIVHLFAPLHECTHYTAFKSRRLNDGVAWLCGLAIVLSPTFSATSTALTTPTPRTKSTTRS